MPAAVTIKKEHSTLSKPYEKPIEAAKKSRVVHIVAPPLSGKVAKEEQLVEASSESSPFPTDLLSRSRFRLATGKPVTPHQWKVYDFILHCPPGKVTTYGLISKALGSSAQAVGGSLRDNPWAPEVPCHRVITSKNFIGGYQGDWGEFGKQEEGMRGGSKKIERKLSLLESEGVEFDENGYLIGGSEVFYKG